MTLGEKQRLFTFKIALLIQYAYADRHFLAMMKRYGVGWARRRWVYLGVRAYPIVKSVR